MFRSAALVLTVVSSAICLAQAEFDDYFPRRSMFGKSANAIDWSKDDRYFTYRWNSIDEPGMDLWLYDAQTGKTTRLTSPDTFKQYDKQLDKALKLYKENLDKAIKTETMSDEEYREFLQQERKKDEDRQKELQKGGDPDPTYDGPNSAAWANTSTDLLLVYKGDLYRMPLDGKPTRLTWTREAETSPQFVPDDSGFTFRRGDGVYYMRFDSPRVIQLNPKLPNKLPLGSYSISPDGTKLMVTSFKDLAPDRTVDYISYRDRFAQAKKANRAVADDKFNQESYVFLYDLKDTLAGNDLADQEPWEVFKFPGGEELWETSINDEPWSPDCNKFVFTTWKRDQKALDVIIADMPSHKTQTIYSTKVDGEHTSPSMANPFFMPDGNRVVIMLESSGFRHAHMIDPITGGAAQITHGNFEVYPQGVTPDGKTLIAYSSKDSPARLGIYAVDIETGSTARSTSQTGNYGSPSVNHARTAAAASFANWHSPSELYVINTLSSGSERKLTDSHRLDRITKLNKMEPEIFSYPNRHGQTVYGYMFKPEGWKRTDKRPLWIYVYGGPLGSSHSVTDGVFASTQYWFAQYLTRQYGILTVTVDPRGQSGYGAAFGKANWDQVGKPQTEDLVDGVKFLTANYGVDSTKVGINGWSFGGFQTQMCLYTAPDVFTLGIAGAGPTEWQNYNNWYTGGVIGNARDGKGEDLDPYSLTNLAKNLKSPLLLLHGMEDTNVLFQDTVKVYRKLLQYGKGHLVELALDPTGGHGMGGDMSNRDRHRIYLEFIKNHWRLESASSGSGR